MNATQTPHRSAIALRTPSTLCKASVCRDWPLSSRPARNLRRFISSTQTVLPTLATPSASMLELHGQSGGGSQDCGSSVALCLKPHRERSGASRGLRNLCWRWEAAHPWVSIRRFCRVTCAYSSLLSHTTHYTVCVCRYLSLSPFSVSLLFCSLLYTPSLIEELSNTPLVGIQSLQSSKSN